MLTPSSRQIMSPSPQTSSATQAVPPMAQPDFDNACTSTNKNAISYSGLSRTTIYRAHKDGRLNIVKVRRTALVRMDSLHALLDVVN